jgi:type VI secretion system protein ImpH
MDDLIRRLAAEGRRFDFFQALSLVEEYYSRQGVSDPVNSGRVRLEADSSLGFPPSDIAGVRDDHGVLRFALSFMGLIGVSSPLPVYFAEFVEVKPEESRALRDFLAMFNHRMYALFYRAWKKYRFQRTFSSLLSDPFTRRVAALAGIGDAASISGEQTRILAYAGLFAGRCRGGASLSALIGDFFGGVPVVVVNWMPRRAELRDVKKLGANARLGVDAIAGTSILDRTGKFRVVVGPLPRATYERFLPGGSTMQRLVELVRAYMADPLEFDVEVMLQSIDLIPVALGLDTAALGRTSSLGASHEKAGIQSFVYEPQ